MLKQLGCISLLLIAVNAVAQSVPATHHTLNYEGRTIKYYSEGIVQLNWPGTSVKTQFSGHTLSVTLIGNGDHFDVLIDGKLTKKLITARGNKPQSFTLLENDDPKKVQVEIVKRTENYDSLTQVISFDHDGSLQGIWETQPHILFIGDSISAGFGSESNKRECTWGEVYASSNARLAFPYQTGEVLNASITQVSFSGLGLIRNWSGNQPHHDLTYYADKASAVFGLTHDFEDTHPNLIVVEVGTNDFSTDPQPHEPWVDIEAVKRDWTDRMVEFVGELRQRYSGVNVILMPRPAYPYDYIIPATSEAIQRLNAQGYEGIYSHTFVSPLEGCIWHPTSEEHKDIANKLSDFIQANKLL
ncbi:SGNH/GDSL hydrolase family protein [Grimontia sp. NTOU-MAR1]|uniref:SGNH/GDSL hydrolase family protein n=1 Tax=Grimontia sp. NTOU-MAR1 TaxID=3111011 RepID=UPI002DBE4C61|nr:GDSL-type esterase/lipase family protein [Grimontia sp. NTOU-MAR1]WRW00819.1 GDSL-type esterase/lipase family protein [Grimontia sp. NTOU-MAR1]